MFEFSSLSIELKTFMCTTFRLLFEEWNAWGDSSKKNHMGKKNQPIILKPKFAALILPFSSSNIRISAVFVVKSVTISKPFQVCSKNKE